MPDESTSRFHSIERKLDEHSEALRGIQKTLNELAVQQEQITRLQADMQDARRNWHELTKPGGTIAKISDFQASCPRGQLKWLWLVVVPQGFALVVLALKLFIS